MSIKALQSYTFQAKYARYNSKLKRRDTWNEAQDRALSMHLGRYPQISEELTWAFDQAKAKRVLGSQRALQYSGAPILKKHARIYNCFSADTTFITDEGVKTFSDFNDGDVTTVLAHTGVWRRAIVKNHGIQPLQKITLKRGQAVHTVKATPDHRWLLQNGQDTTSLSIGDAVSYAPNIFNEFVYEEATSEERLYWAYGYVFGDGSLVKKKDGTYGSSMVRLCGHDVNYLSRFQELGFPDSTSTSLAGDTIVFTGKYLKTPPDPSKDNPALIRAFVRGYLDADGTKNRAINPIEYGSPNVFTNIQATGSKHIEFIRKCFPIAGVYIVSEKDLTGQVTNFGARPETILFRIINGFGKTATQFKVVDIEPIGEANVWCVEVEEDHSFTLPFGVVTGNCTVSYCDRIRFFQEAMWLLLCGCGVGFSVQQHHIGKLPNFLSTRLDGATDITPRVFTIPDDIEGWSNALGVLLATYFPHPEYPEWAGKEVSFDYSIIRPKGSALSSGAGKAPGPDGLKKALEEIRSLLNRCLNDNQSRLRSIDAYDIVMHSSDAVISGGVRRSATICIFSPGDELMTKAKTGDWYYTNPQRGRSNNSVMLVRDNTSREYFHELMSSVRQFGEPGFVWSNSTEIMFNPCVEISMYPVDITTGETGWAFCNLCEINGKKCKTKDDFVIAAKAAAIIGTAQAGYTDFDYLGNTTKRIVEREALLGVSITGMMDSPEILFDPEIQREVASIVVATNKEIAEKIGINQAARCTCVKPAGSTSCILGTSSGIHAHHSKRYIRRVQANLLEAPYQFFTQKNPRATELSVWSKNGTDAVISFCIETAEGARTRRDVNAIKLLEAVRLTQNNWVEAGTNTELCVQPFLRHNVSNTINVKIDEWNDVEDYIYEHRADFAGISLLSSTGDLDYPQAPFVAIHTPAEIVKMYGDGSLMASGLIVDGLTAFGDNLWLACDYVTGVNQLADNDDNFANKQNWIRRAHQFADRYFGGDVRLTTYCLKEVHNWKYWCDLQREYVDVDYSELTEEEDNTKIQETIACAGGVCELF